MEKLRRRRQHQREVAGPAPAPKAMTALPATVAHTRGGIGYVENAYATQNHLVTVQLRNKAGNFVKPTIAGLPGRRLRR